MEQKKRKTHTSAAVKRRYAKKNYARLNIEIKKELVENFRAACLERGVSQSSVIRDAIESFLAEER